MPCLHNPLHENRAVAAALLDPAALSELGHLPLHLLAEDRQHTDQCLETNYSQWS